MHKNIKTVAGCFTNVTCNVAATDGREVELTAYIAIGQERRPVPKAGANLFAFPAVEYGQYLYEIRANGKPIIFGFLLVRTSAFPVAEGTVDYTLTSTLDSVDALHVDIELTPGPRGYSAYDIAVMEGFEGTESEWLEYMRQQTATLAVEQVTPLMERAENARTGAEQAKADAQTAETNAREYAETATVAMTGAEQAKADAQTAETNARGYAETAAEAKTGAEQAKADAQTAETNAREYAETATAARTGAEQAKADAQTAETNARGYATAATEAKTGAEQAKDEALAAKATAEEQARIAAEAAAEVLGPGSVAVAAARPAVMVLLRQELESLLGDAVAWVVDTDGEKVVVHTDRLDGELLAAVTDMLERFVPGFIGLRRYNHDMSIPWQEIPDGFKVVEWLESVDLQKISLGSSVNLGTSEDILIARCLAPYFAEHNYRYPIILRVNKEEGAYTEYAFNVSCVYTNSSVQSWNGKSFIIFKVEGRDAEGDVPRPKDWVTEPNNADFVVVPDVPFELSVERRVFSFNGVPRRKIDANYVFPVEDITSIGLFYYWANTPWRIYDVQRISVDTGETLFSLICCLDDRGAPCMLDRVSGTVFYNKGKGDFLYPGKEEEASTFSLRRPVMYAQLTPNGVRRLYHVPQGYNGSREEYAAEFGFKPLVETAEPEPVEGVVWEPVWRETEDELVLEWVEEERR